MFDIGIGNNGEVEIFSEILHYVLLEGIGTLFTIIAFIFIILASIKLFRGDNIPGTKLIFYSIIFTIIGAVTSVLYTLVLNIEENYIIEALFNIYLGVVFFMGSYGFWCLAKYIVNKSANKALSSDN